MTAMLLTLTLAAPVPKGDPPPSGFRDGQKMVYATLMTRDGKAVPSAGFTVTTTLIKTIPDGDLFRWEYQLNIAGHEPRTAYYRITRDDVREVDEHGRSAAGVSATPRGGWWRKANRGDVQAHRDGTADARSTYHGDEEVRVAAGVFMCARVTTEVFEPDGRLFSRRTIWYAVKEGIRVKVKDEPPERVVQVDELASFTPGK